MYLINHDMAAPVYLNVCLSKLNPGCFGPGSFRPESFRPGSFRPILGVGRFGLGRWVVSANFLGESIRPRVVSAKVYGNLLVSNNSKIN